MRETFSHLNSELTRVDKKLMPCGCILPLTTMWLSLRTICSLSNACSKGFGTGCDSSCACSSATYGKTPCSLAKFAFRFSVSLLIYAFGLLAVFSSTHAFHRLQAYFSFFVAFFSTSFCNTWCAI